MSRPFLVGTSPAVLREWAKSHDLPAFRGTQIADWVYKKGIVEPERMNNLPLPVRELIGNEFLAPGTAVTRNGRLRGRYRKAAADFAGRRND